MSFLTEKPIGIVYNFPNEFNAVATELWNRDIPLTFIDPSKIFLEAGNTHFPFSLLFNDLSYPTGYPFHQEHATSLTSYVRHLELTNERSAKGRIINGSHALEYFTSRLSQISLFASLKIKYPRTIIASNLDQLIKGIHSLRFPILIKENNIAKANTVFRFDTVSALIEAVLEEKLFLNNDILLAQEYRHPKSDDIIRVDTLNGKVFAAQKVHTLREPALSWDLELESENVEPGIAIVEKVEEIVRTARVDIGSVEYFIDQKTNEAVFYNIAPFNYSRNRDKEGVQISAVGDFFEKRLHKIREVELAL